MSDIKIAIVGAGISGISAAYHLQQAGFSNLKIFEGLNRIGGRIETRYYKESDGRAYKMEFGAEWIHGINKNPVHKVAADNKLYEPLQCTYTLGVEPHESTAYNENVVKLCTSGVILPQTNEKIENIVEEAIEKADKLSENKDPATLSKYPSFGDCVMDLIKKKFAKLSKTEQELCNTIMEQKLNAISIYEGCGDLKDVSMLCYAQYEDFTGKEPKIAQGTIKLVESLAKGLKADQISINNAVTKIKYVTVSDQARGNVVIHTADGASETFDCVIVTCSLGVLQESHTRMFEPALPQVKVDALSHLKLGIINRVYLEYDNLDFLPANAEVLELYWCDADRASLPDWTWRMAYIDVLVEKPIRNVLVVWLSGNEALKMEKLSEDDVSRGCHLVLSHFLKSSTVPPPKRIQRSCWYSNEFVRGSYSFDGLEAKEADRDNLAAPIRHTASKKPIVLFAGEATHKRHYSTLQGAYLSGQREAKNIAGSWTH